ncbi:MAG TPA: type III-B CRISPR module-associated protein Cmr5 [Alphaproteobacteria bacterium]|nr:type III-B CRISPR module-associated protein Cmr5 [Alphaproteobacteria bacterium]
MTAQTLEQRRAKHALEKIKSVNQDKADDYVRHVKALPAAILMNGLGQALATELASGKNDSDPHRLLAKHVSEWLLSKEAHTKYPSEGPRADAASLLDQIVAGDQDAYLWAQTEAIAYVTWLKKFANAFLDPPRKE